MSNWYYAKNNQQLGPVSEDELRQMLAGGAVSPNDLVWREGMANWQAASGVPELSPPAPAPTQEAAPGATHYAAQQQPAPQYGGYPQQPVGAPQPLPYGHYGYAPGTPPPPNYLVQAILVTIFCCWPLGIPAIVFAAQVNSKHSTGDIQGARDASDKAKRWTWIALWCGLIPMVLYFVVMVIGVVAGGGGGPRF